MGNDAKRIRRAGLIARVRAVEHRQAAVQAHEAEAARRKFVSLCDRTQALAQVYATGEGALEAADLRSARLLAAHLLGLGQSANAQAELARMTADARLDALAAADKRRSRAESDRRDLFRANLERRLQPELPMQRRNGTEIE